MAFDHSNGVKSISDISFSFPTFTQIIDVLTFQAGFNSAIVVIGATLLGIAAGTIGVFALLRKRALMADALAHSALPGLAIAFLIGSLSGIGGKHVWLLLLGATLSGILGVVCVQLLSSYTRLYEDTAIGAVLSCFFGAGIVLLSLIQSLGTGEEGGLSHFIYGQTAAMNRADAYAMLGASLLSILVATKCLKEFRLVCFDEQFAASDGWSVSIIDFIMMSIVVIVTVVGLQSVGLLLIVAFLVVPPAGARFWTENLSRMVWVSACIGGLSGYIGSSLSALLPRFPAGAVIVLVAGSIFFVSFFFAPARGLVALLVRQLRLRIRIMEDHLLRDMYELLDIQENLELWKSTPLALDQIPLYKQCSSWRAAIIKWWFSQTGYIRFDGEKVFFTYAGFAEAEKKVRNHRLWEEYLITHADFSVSHVDYSADLVEHTLSPEMIAKLEEKLNAKQQIVPKSVHAITAGG